MSDDRVELKPCPFDGDAGVLCFNLERPAAPMYWILCRKCHACPGDRPTEADAIAAWNTRALDPSIESLQAAEVERLRFERDDARKALFQMRDMLIAVHDGLEDEGDRVYLGSSNHAELIHEAWHYADAIKWDAFLEGDTAAKEQTRDR